MQKAQRQHGYVNVCVCVCMYGREQMCSVVGSPRSLSLSRLHFPLPIVLLLRLCSPLICFAAVFVRLLLYSPRSCFSFFSFFFIFAFHVHFLLSIEFNGVALQSLSSTGKGRLGNGRLRQGWMEVDRSTWSENHANTRGCGRVGASGVAWLVLLATNRDGGSICSPRQLFHSTTLPLWVCVRVCVSGGRKNPNATKIPFCPIWCLLDRGLLLAVRALSGAASNWRASIASIRYSKIPKTRRSLEKY